MEAPLWFRHFLSSTDDEGRAMATGPGLASNLSDSLVSIVQREDMHKFAIHGLIQVSPHQQAGSIFSPLNREEDILFGFLGNPSDAYSLQITNVKRFQHTIEMLTTVDCSLISLRRSSFLFRVLKFLT